MLPISLAHKGPADAVRLAAKSHTDVDTGGRRVLCFKCLPAVIEISSFKLSFNVGCKIIQPAARQVKWPVQLTPKLSYKHRVRLFYRCR